MQAGPSTPTSPRSVQRHINPENGETVIEYTPTLANNLITLAMSELDLDQSQIFKLPHESYAFNIFCPFLDHLNTIGDIDLLSKEELGHLNEKLDKIVSEIKAQGESKNKKFNLNFILDHLWARLIKSSVMNGNILRAKDPKDTKLQCARELFEADLRYVLATLQESQKAPSLHLINFRLTENDMEFIQKRFLAFVGQLTVIDPFRAKIFHNLIHLLQRTPAENMSAELLGSVFSPVFCKALQLDNIFFRTDVEEEKNAMLRSESAFFARIFSAILGIDQFGKQYSIELYAEYSQEDFNTLFEMRYGTSIELSQEVFDKVLPVYLGADVLFLDPALSLKIQCSRQILESELKVCLGSELSTSSLDFSKLNEARIQDIFVSFIGQLVEISHLNYKLPKTFHNFLYYLKGIISQEKNLNSNYAALFAKALQLNGKLFEPAIEKIFFEFVLTTLLKLEMFAEHFTLESYSEAKQPSYNAHLSLLYRSLRLEWKGTEKATSATEIVKRHRLIRGSHSQDSVELPALKSTEETEKEVSSLTKKVKALSLSRPSDPADSFELTQGRIKRSDSPSSKSKLLCAGDSIIITRKRVESAPEPVKEENLPPLVLSPRGDNRDKIVRGRGVPLLASYHSGRGQGKNPKKTTKEEVKKSKGEEPLKKRNSKD